MKLIFIRLLSLTMALLLLLATAGCGKQEPEIDAQAVLQSLLEQVTFETELSQVGGYAELYFPDLPQDTTIQLYTGSGYCADEVALLSLASEADSGKAMDAVETHLAELRSQFANYVPAEVDKIDGAVVRQNGCYIFLCISNDRSSAELILKNANDPAYQLPSEGVHTTGNTVNQATGTVEQVTTHETTISTEGTGNKDTTVPTTEATGSTAPNESSQNEYPRLTSKSGTYTEYGSAAIRVDDCVFEEYDYVDSRANAYAQIINKAAEQLDGVTTVYALAIPTAIGITLPDDIAAQLPGLDDQGEAIEKIFSKMDSRIVTVNCFDNLMRHRDEYIYFRTDHHWNGRGAYYAYEAFCRVKGFAPYTLSQREARQFGGFLGSYYQNGKEGKSILGENPDTVYAYYPASSRATMCYTDKKGNTYNWNIISDVTNWMASAKYSTFAGADNPIAVFTNPDVTEGSVCVIVKESYGNALLPYLVDHYSTVYEIDYRYWEGNLVEFTREKGANDLIFANNLSMIRSNLLIGQLAEIVG